MQHAPLGHVRFKVISILVASLGLILLSIVLAIAGFRWWPLSLFGLLPVFTVHKLSDGGRALDPESWFKGWRGESLVKKLLKGLEPLGYRIVNHLDIGHGDVDHVVVGPTGIFAIDTKNHAGHFSQRGASLLKNGWPDDGILDQVRGEAAAVRDRIGVKWVQAVVVVPTGGVEDPRLYFQKATVVDNDGLLDFITSQGSRLESSEIERIIGLLAHR
jgi:Nuclease-related domain